MPGPYPLPEYWKVHVPSCQQPEAASLKLPWLRYHTSSWIPSRYAGAYSQTLPADAYTLLRFRLPAPSLSQVPAEGPCCLCGFPWIPASALQLPLLLSCLPEQFLPRSPSRRFLLLPEHHPQPLLPRLSPLLYLHLHLSYWPFSFTPSPFLNISSSSIVRFFSVLTTFL